MNKKNTTSKMATKAAQVLQSDNSSAIQKQLAASVLSQSSNKKMTGKEMEIKASMVLNSDKYSKTTKSLAASVLSQSDKNR